MRAVLVGSIATVNGPFLVPTTLTMRVSETLSGMEEVSYTANPYPAFSIEKAAGGL